MERIHFPLLYFRLTGDQVMGLLVGTSHQAIAANVGALKLKFLDFLRKEYKKFDTYPDIRMRDPQLKVFTIPFQPAYRNGSGVYPLPYTLQVPIPAVFGENPLGNYYCYLPFFDDHFPYFSPAHFEPLTDYIAKSYLNSYSPEQVIELMQYGTPSIETIELRVKDRFSPSWDRGAMFRRQHATLSRIAEQYPATKAVRRLQKVAPEAAWEREQQVDEVVEKVLSSRSNVLVVGPPGSGKSAVLQQAIRKMTNRAKNARLGISFWRILPQRITGSAKYLGEWEEICEEIISELATTNGILWVVSLVRLMMTGGVGAEDSVAAFFKTALQQGRLQMIGEATPQELESMRRLLPSFVDAFRIVRIEELPEEKIQSILQKYSNYTRVAHQVQIEPQALDMSYRLLSRYYPYESFPGKAIKFLGKCLSDAKMAKKELITLADVTQHFIQQTGLPELLVNDQKKLDEEALRSFFSSRILGQPRAVQQLCNLVKIFKAGINNPNRPIATLIFAGPTGVGKTASAKALADYFFGEGQKRTPLIRIDMSEYQNPYQLGKLFGSGAEPGLLVKEIREKPFAVLLLDEIEKADSSVFDALLAVLDEGILTDGYGRVTHFKNTIIIMTSNLGASNRQRIGFSETTSDENRYLSALSAHFRPEFINRIDGLVIFDALFENDIRNLAKKELEELAKREGFTKRNLRLEFSDRVIDYLTAIGFDERYGARPLQRAIEQSITSSIARWLLDNPTAQGLLLKIDYNGILLIEPISQEEL